MAGCPLKRELEIFRQEVNAAAQFLYGALAVGTLAEHKPRVVKRLNIAPLFWQTVLFSLQKSAILALGRVFEKKGDSKHNAARLMWEAKRIEIFSKDALRHRKFEQSGPEAAEWIDDFLASAYEPSEDDIAGLSEELDKWRTIYNAKYKPLRNKSFAHREFANDTEELHELIVKTKLGELKRMCLFLIALHDALWELYRNGRKPDVTPPRHSILDLLSPDHRRKSAPEIIVGQVREFFAEDLSE